MKILDSTYVKAKLKQVADNATHMNDEERTQLIRILEDLNKCFDGTLGDWDTYPADLKPKPDSKLFNCKYYPVSSINKEMFCKELKLLVKMGVLTPVKHSQYDTTVFIIPKKEGNVRFITDYCRLNQQLVRKTYTLPIICKTMQQL